MAHFIIQCNCGRTLSQCRCASSNKSVRVSEKPCTHQRPDEASDRECAWADYRSDYGVDQAEMVAAHKAFMAGWKAAREGDQSGVLR